MIKAHPLNRVSTHHPLKKSSERRQRNPYPHIQHHRQRWRRVSHQKLENYFFRCLGGKEGERKNTQGIEYWPLAQGKLQGSLEGNPEKGTNSQVEVTFEPPQGKGRHSGTKHNYPRCPRDTQNPWVKMAVCHSIRYIDWG